MLSVCVLLESADEALGRMGPGLCWDGRSLWSLVTTGSVQEGRPLSLAAVPGTPW